MLAGELGRQRIVWVGFDTLESTWPLARFVPDLHRQRGRLAQSRRHPIKTIRAWAAGDPFRLTLAEPAKTAEVRLPDGATRKLELDPKARELVFGDTGKQGVYRLTVGTNETVFCANLLDPAESDIRPRDELDFGKFGNVSATRMKRASLELWRWIAAAGLAVLLFEWWYYHKRTA